MSQLNDLLNQLARKDLQRLAKSIGVKANGKSAEIVALLIEAHDTDPSTFSSTAEVAEVLPDWQSSGAHEATKEASTDVNEDTQIVSQLGAALSPLPDSGAVEVAESMDTTGQTPEDTTALESALLQNNPLFDEPGQTSTPMDDMASPAGKENSTPAAAAQAQATPCQLTEEAMRRAYEKGRKSGLWQGAAEFGLQELEKEWDNVKAKPIRGWTLPSMSEVKAKSTHLKSLGFTTVGSPERGGTTNLKKPTRTTGATGRSSQGNTPSRLARPSVKARTPGKNHVDRAKEAEEAFKARRAAALAKSRAAR